MLCDLLRSVHLVRTNIRTHTLTTTHRVHVGAVLSQLNSETLYPTPFEYKQYTHTAQNTYANTRSRIQLLRRVQNTHTHTFTEFVKYNWPNFQTETQLKI